MKQTNLGIGLSVGRTRKLVLLNEMERVMPWSDLRASISPDAPVTKTGWPQFKLAMVRRRTSMT